jgi:hypothetical protein
MYILRWDDKALSYSRMRDLFIQAFQSFVPDIKKLGLHSLTQIPFKIQHTQVNMHKLYVEKINHFLYN